MSRFDTAVRGQKFIEGCKKLKSEDLEKQFRDIGAENEYDALVENLEELTRLTDSLYEMDRHGGYRMINRTLDDSDETYFDRLKAAYKKVHETAETLYLKLPLHGGAIVSGYEEAGKTLASLDGTIEPDIALFNTFSSDEFVSLPELMYRSGVKTYDISDVVETTVGGNQSSRIPMKLVDSDGRTVEGFFTHSSTYDPFTPFIESVSKVRAEISGKVSKKVLNAYDAFTQTIIKKKRGDFFEFLGDKDSDTEEETTLADIAFNDTNAYRGLSYNEESSLTEVLEKLTYDFLPHYSLQDAINQSREVTYKSNIDRRNSAMSDVASLLGIRRVIAESEDVKVKDSSGQEYEGTFMEMADGYPIESVFFKGEEQFTGQAKKDLADMQILDYICFNVDRHAGNLFLKQDGKGNITGMVGIDNDASFGGRLGFNSAIFNRLTNISNIKFISKDLAEKLVNLDVGIFTSVLRGRGIPENEILAAQVRLGDCQKVAEGALKRVNFVADPNIEAPNYAVALDDDAFEDLKMDSYVKKSILKDKKKKKDNLFHYLKILSNGLKDRDPKSFKAIDMSDKKATETDKDEKTEKGLRNSLRLLVDYKNRLSNATSFFRGSSQNYKDLQSEVDNAIDTLGEVLSDRSVSKLNVTIEDYELCNKALNEVLKKAGNYISVKENEKERSNYAEKRLNLAKDFSTELKASISQMEFKQDIERNEMEVMNMNKMSSAMLEEIMKTEEALDSFGKLTNAHEKADYILNKLPKLSSQAYASFDDKIGSLIEKEGDQLPSDVIERLNVSKYVSKICKDGKEAADILSTNTEYQGEKLGEGHKFKDVPQCKLAFAKMKIADNILNSRGVGNIQKVFEEYHNSFVKDGGRKKSFDAVVNERIKKGSFYKKFVSMDFRDTLKVLDDSSIGNRKNFISLNSSLDLEFKIQKDSVAGKTTSSFIKNTRVK